MSDSQKEGGSDGSGGFSMKVNQPCWYELPVINAPRAIAFYRAVLEWDIKDEPIPDTFTGEKRLYNFSKGSMNGMLIAQRPEDVIAVATAGDGDSLAPSGRNERMGGVLVTYAVQSIEEALKKVEDAGGKTVM